MIRSFVRLSRLPAFSEARNFSGNVRNVRRQDLTRRLLDAKRTKNRSFKDLAEELKHNKVWLTSVILGEHPADPQTATALLKTLEMFSDPNDVETLCSIPENRGQRDQTFGKDPIVRRFDELLDVYGDTFKAIIREEAGDGIMSAIDCTVNFETIKKGDEIRIVLNVDGKFLKYKH